MKTRTLRQPAAIWLPRQVELPSALAVALMNAAIKSVQLASQTVAHARRSRRGITLRPGRDTPLWNELANAVQAQLTRRGDKARLARVLGLPRQRVQDLVRARRQLPDAERTLLLLVWLQARHDGRDLA
jgi:hypothetical protein